MDNWDLSKFVSIEEITQKLKSARRYGDEVTFSSLEPTLHPRLSEIISIAKQMNFSRIEIVTNGRRLSDIEYAKKLISSGLNEIDISIHSYIPEKHDMIVRSPWAFREGLMGLINVSRLLRYHSVSLTVSVTVCRQNYQEIPQLVSFLERFPLKNIVLNILQIRNSAKENMDLTMISYSEMIPYFLKIRKAQETFGNIYINWLVPCLSRYLLGTSGYFNGAQINRQSSSGGWYIVDFDSFKKKREECRDCVYDSSCEWVWGSYVDKNWWSEFSPVKES